MIGSGGDLGDSFSSWGRNYEVASQVVKRQKGRRPGSSIKGDMWKKGMVWGKEHS